MPMIKVRSKKCPLCGEAKEFEVDKDAFESFMQGEHIQDAFPTMSADDRERFLSGYCPKCWDKLFAKFDEE